MKDQDPRKNGELLLQARLALGMNSVEMGAVLGVSRRTVSRWESEGTWLDDGTVATLVVAVYPHDAALAAGIAAVGERTLDDFGLAVPEPPIDAVVSAAAAAGAMTPMQVRGSLLAAVKRARELGLTLEELESMLERGEAGAKSGA